MDDDDNNTFDYNVLKQRIDKAKKNPLYGLDKNDINDISRVWSKSFSSLSNPGRRSISDNLNYIEFLKIISKYTHVKSKVGFMVYIGDYTLSILGGDGAFCDEVTFEVAILDTNMSIVTGKQIGRAHV